jgi:DNA-binding HxlR family transcriptional regulator
VLNRDYAGQNCSAARALELVGERWSLLILRDAAFRGTTRFSEFQRSLGVAPNVLASRLQGFVRAGLMTLGTDADSAPRYQLTEMGTALKPVIAALTAWGDQWVPPYARPVRFQHAGCGGEVAVTVTCSACGALVPAERLAAVRAEDGTQV